MLNTNGIPIVTRNSKIFRPNVLNIFTDASIKRIEEHAWRGCAGAVGVFYDEELDDYDTMTNLMLLNRCTNNIAELAGIELGVDMSLANQYNFSRINLFSDSNISVHTFRKWIFGWCRNRGAYRFPERMGELRTSSGKLVKNLTHILDIVNKICDIEQCEFNIYHCRGHHMKKLDTFIESFKTENNLTISDTDARLLALYNDLIDQETRNIVENFLNENEYSEIIHEYAPYAITPLNMRKYFRIIGGREF